MRDLTTRFIAATVVFALLLVVISFLDGSLTELLTELTAGLTFEALKISNSDHYYLIHFPLYESGKQYKVWSVYNDFFRVNISDGCNGMAIILLYNWFLFSQVFSWKRTLSFSLFGSVSLIGLNVLRLIFLFYLSRASSFWFDFMHKGVFQIAMYLCMVSLWFLFLREKKEI